MTQTAIPTPGEVANNPALFARAFLRIFDKDKRLVPLHYNPPQRHYLKHRTRRDLILKARQLGFSTMIQAEFFRLVTTRRAAVQTLGNDDENTQKLRRIFQRFYDKLPGDVPKPARKLDNASISTFTDFDSEVLIATAGNRNAGRGGTYTHIHGSEVAFWPDAESIVAATLQGGNPSVVLESTPNGAQGYFYNLCMEAIDGNSDWKLHFYPWWFDPLYTLPVAEPLTYSDDEARLIEAHGLTDGQIAWRRAKQRELGRLFAQEYPEDARSCFLLSGDSYFGPLEGVYTAPFGATPQDGHRYVGGLDFGQANDWTVLSIVDATTAQQVALVRLNKLPWADMRARIIAACRDWRVQQLWAESNSIGGPNIEALTAAGLPVVPFATTAESKPLLIAGYNAALNEAGLKLLDVPEQRREHQAFTARQTATGRWTYAAQAPEHDDIVMANAIAWHGVAAGGPLILFEF